MNFLIDGCFGKITDYMSNGLRIFQDELGLFAHYKRRHLICFHLNLLIKDEMFHLRYKCHLRVTMTLRNAYKYHQSTLLIFHLQRFLSSLFPLFSSC